MKNTIINTMATTGLSVIVLAILIRAIGFELYFTRTVLPAFGANIVIHLGFLITKHFESKYLALEVLLDMAYTTAVLVVFGLIFDWFGATPVLILVTMAAVIHLVSLFLNMARIQGDANTINKLLAKRDKKNGFIGRVMHASKE